MLVKEICDLAAIRRPIILCRPDGDAKHGLIMTLLENYKQHRRRQQYAVLGHQIDGLKEKPRGFVVLDPITRDSSAKTIIDKQ